MTPLEGDFQLAAAYVALAIEVGAVLVVAWGASQAIVTLIGAIVSPVRPTRSADA